MKLTTWNINSVRLRLPSLAKLIKEVSPDVICLQEIKVITELFPGEDIAALGYPHQAVAGMKGYNGVAILSKTPLSKITTKNWCGKEDCRHIFASIDGSDFGGKAGPVEIHNFYIPAGGDEPDPKKNEKFAHKLKFLEETTKWHKGRRKKTAARIMVGDLNIAPLETDVWSHKQLLKVVSHTPVEVEGLDKLQAAGPWVDAVREIIPPEKSVFSWWSYRSKDWTVNDRGRRLDHVWVTEPLKSKIADAHIFRDARSWEKPSDHVPITITFKL
ncbi:MAG: exodeoxyribonuclease III [Rhodospirillaceae bacterium]|mgnify:CR=1 FL=1|jgi:exodeoxyribonuclease III|nr:exodeoxyribonuclease III [Rhodospirillaceae bacterium]MBT4588276.1 exodeoxyribonuclease III [Rhodospirillaceae bacterium]MBT4938976.1 exodeoxyribonuclease III [Rhodospirillaceae bacterium]MBT7269214.1 exodeoxyribonuclease III [Rhodospirillaceae bacterium]